MSFLRDLKLRLSFRNFRKSADVIYARFPFFHLSSEEFNERCLALQRCGAGIVLGYVKDDFEVRITDISRPYAIGSEVPLGYFGEIIFRKKCYIDFSHTGLYGFFDQRGRVWCCGSVAGTAVRNCHQYFPLCIEPIFQWLWWVHEAKFSFSSLEGLVWFKITVMPRKILSPLVNFFRNHFLRKLTKFAEKFKITSEIDEFEIAESLKPDS